MRKRKYCYLLNANLLLESSNLNGSGEVSDLSELLKTSFSNKLIEVSDKEKWVGLICFSNLMARTRKMVGMDEGPRTSGTSRGDRSDPQGMEFPEKLQVKGVKREKRRRWDLAVTAAKLAKENQKARQGRKDESIGDWMKNIKRVADTGVEK